jgi:hypothetical protein
LLVDEASDPTSIEDVVVASSNTTDDVRAGLEQSSAEDRHDFDHEQQPQHSGQQNLVPAHREIESLLFTPGAAFIMNLNGRLACYLYCEKDIS